MKRKAGDAWAALYLSVTNGYNLLTKFRDDEGVRELGSKQICITMRKAAVEMQEDKIRHNGRENVNSVLISGTATAAFKDLYPSHAN